MRIVDDRGQEIVTTRITFVAPSVDPQTQSVLAKAALDRPGTFRTDQFVRARVVWRSSPGLTIPVVAVTRVNGRYFAFVAEPARVAPPSPASGRSNWGRSPATTTSSRRACRSATG